MLKLQQQAFEDSCVGVKVLLIHVPKLQLPP